MSKLINILYRGGGGGEFLGSILTTHKDIVTKNVDYDETIERWHFERDDELSQRYIDGSQPVSATDWDDSLWNIRLDHGYGFHVHKEYYRDYLWSNWSKTKTILLQPKEESSVKYIDRLVKTKVKPGPNNKDGQWLVQNGFDMKKFWGQPWKSCQELTTLYKDMIPSGHDYIEIDPCELFHRSRVRSDFALNRIIKYLELDDYLIDEWMFKIEKYRIKNKILINKTIV
jgi:hypothetical protein